MIDKLIEALEKELEVPSLKTEVAGVFAIPLEDGITITIVKDGEWIRIRSDFLEFNASPSIDQFQEMLLANLFGQGTNGGVLGYKEDTKSITLIKEVREDIGIKEFIETIEDYMNALDFWLDKYKSFKGSAR